MKALLYTVYLAGQGLETQFPPIGGTATDQQVEDAYAACVSADSFTDLAGITHQTQKATLYYNARFNEIGAFQGGDVHETHDRIAADPSAGDLSFTGNVAVGGALTVTGDATIGGTITATGGQIFAGAVDMDSTLNVDGAVTLGSTANVVGNFSVATNKLTVAAASGNTLVAGTLTTTGAVDCDSTLNADGAATFGSTANVVGNFSVATNKLTVAAASGNTVVAGTLGVTGASTFTGVLTANGLILPQQHATAGGPAYVEGAIYYDTTLHKLRIGGAAGWETITSA